MARGPRHNKTAHRGLWTVSLPAALTDYRCSPECYQFGAGVLTWEQDAFAYAESYDESADRYRGLRFGEPVSVTGDDPGLLVRPEVARRQIDQETATTVPGIEETVSSTTPGTTSTTLTEQPSVKIQPPKPKRCHGTVILDSARLGRDASKIADEVITHLAGLVRSSVRVTLEIEAEIPEGAPDNVVRTVTENSRTLKFESSGFEME
jgi:hypothetical protein